VIHRRVAGKVTAGIQERAKTGDIGDGKIFHCDD
jgi:nitrogen regulatory protein PII